MKKSRIVLLLSLILLLAMSVAEAQKNYIQVGEKDGVEFSYLWKKSKVLKKDSPMILFLQIDNANEHNVSVDFTVDYYWNGIRSASSDPNNRCIKAGKTLKGKIKDLTFEKAGYSDQDIASASFSMDVTGVKVTRVETCKKSKK